MTEHRAKILPEHFEGVLSLRKGFEVRNNDRGYKVGDTILLEEIWSADDPGYTGRTAGPFPITYLTDFGCQEGYVVLGLDLTTGQLTERIVEDARAHVTAYYSAKGVVDFVRTTVFDQAAAGHAKGMLLAAMKSMDLSLQALQRIKGSLNETAWWTLCAKSHPLHLIENQALMAQEMAQGIRQAAASAGLPAPFAEGFITDLAKRLD